jgi:adenine-specific DNA-methyltransferase
MAWVDKTSLTQNAATMKICISGSISIRALPAEARERIKNIANLDADVLVGDAPGVDTLVQKELLARGHTRVTIWHRGSAPRNNVGGWPTRPVRGSYTDRDRAMCDAAEFGLAIWDGQSRGTARNIEQLRGRMRVVHV